VPHLSDLVFERCGFRLNFMLHVDQYDAGGQRIRKTTGSTNVDFLYDLTGHEIAEVTSTGAWNRGEVYAGGRHLATYSGGTTYFIHADWLGTERVRTTAAGAVYETCTSLPFGDWLTCSGSDASPMHFTGKERDAESGLDDFGARYYSNRFGRWLSADWSNVPVPVPYANLVNPQTLNLYSMVADDPESFADLDGHKLPSQDDQVPGANPDFNCDIAKASNCAQQPPPPQETPPAQMSSWQFLKAEASGAWDASGGAILGLGASLLSGEAEKNIATTVEWTVTNPAKIVEGVKEAGHEVAQTVESAASGNPRAIGQVVGTAATIAYSARNVRVRAYENTGGGGLNIRNTPTRGSSLRLDFHPLEKGGSYRPHVDVTIKKPGIPSGEGSNLIKPIHHWPWD